MRRHEQVLAEAAAAGSELVVFHEMSLTGSVDPSTHPERLIGIDDPSVAALVRGSVTHELAVCFGIAERSEEGDCYIAQLVVADGAILGVQRKRHLGEGEDSFNAGTSSEVFRLGDLRFGIAICAEAGFDEPFDAAAAGGARLVLFLAAPGLHGRRRSESEWRRGFSWWQGCSLGDAKRHAVRSAVWIALAGQAGSTIDEDFPGLAALVDPDGQVVDRLPDWHEGVLTLDIPI